MASAGASTPAIASVLGLFADGDSAVGGVGLKAAASVVAASLASAILAEPTEDPQPVTPLSVTPFQSVPPVVTSPIF